MSFARVIAARKTASYIRDLTFSRSHLVEMEEQFALPTAAPDPETNVIVRQQQEIMLRLLGSLPKRDRDVLIRFYLHEQPAEQIQRELNLTETQFRLIKSRAKKRFTLMSQRSLSARPATLLPLGEGIQSPKKPIQPSRLADIFRDRLAGFAPLLRANA